MRDIIIQNIPKKLNFMIQPIPRGRVRQVIAHLRNNGIIAYATESCFGLGVLPNRPKAIKKLIHLKKRTNDKGLIIIGSQIQQFRHFIKPLSKTDATYLTSEWPAAKTFLVPAKTTIFPPLRGTQRKRIAIRIPDHAQACFLCQQVQFSLVSTSANISHKRTCKTTRETYRQFAKKKVLIVSGLTGNYKNNSQILDLSTRRQIR